MEKDIEDINLWDIVAVAFYNKTNEDLEKENRKMDNKTIKMEIDKETAQKYMEKFMQCQQTENRRKKLGIPNFGGNLVLSGYDTERDLKRAKEDIERMLMIVASESVYNIMKFLAPYRAKMAKREELEYGDLTERAKNDG